ncbi:MAG: STAS-like domain-containing protein [Bacteroidales bacterium]|nr:STAS-like domain-containing protein [Bacteroidales bacterium]
MKRIQLSDIMTSNKILSDAGTMFYKELISALSASEKVTVDMTGVNSIPSVFLNVSIGRLIDEKGIGALRNNVAFTMITKQQALRLKEYIEKYSVKMELV